jgi:hypothetical protein
VAFLSIRIASLLYSSSQIVIHEALLDLGNISGSSL